MHDYNELDAPRPGNPDVVRALEILLAEARKGFIRYLAAVWCWEPDQGRAGLFGNIAEEEVARKGIGSIAEALDKSLLNRTLPPRDPALGADHVCYNTAGAPLTFDFITWLVDAEMTRIREGAPAPLKVAFFNGRDSNPALDIPYRRAMLDNVIRPALALIGAVETDAALLGRSKEFFSWRYIIDAARAGEQPPVLKAPPEAKAAVASWLGTSRPVTITLREAPHWNFLNSNVEAWLCFAGDLEARGEDVIIVRDTGKASAAPLSRHREFAGASFNLHTRMALYERARCNMFVSNGPATLAFFSNRPWLMFAELVPDDHPYFPGRRSFWRDKIGMGSGDQWPWSRSDQRIVWAKDSYENIAAAWQRFCTSALTASAA